MCVIRIVAPALGPLVIWKSTLFCVPPGFNGLTSGSEKKCAVPFVGARPTEPHGLNTSMPFIPGSIADDHLLVPIAPPAKASAKTPCEFRLLRPAAAVAPVPLGSANCPRPVGRLVSSEEPCP